MIVGVRPLWGLALRASVPASANDVRGAGRGRWVNHPWPLWAFRPGVCRRALSRVLRLPWVLS